MNLSDMALLTMIKKIYADIRQLLHIWLPSSLAFLNKMSINRLTLIGFALVTFPLVTALISSANYVNELTKQSTTAIYHVAQLTQLHRKLNDNIDKMERSVSQYIVLKDAELLEIFQRQQKAFQHTIRKTYTSELDTTLKKNLKELNVEQKHLKSLVDSDKIENISLAQIQLKFKTLRALSRRVEKRSNVVSDKQVNDIHHTTEVINHTILTRLYIIPITLLVAVIFIILITKPLKRLIKQIKRLEQGDFEQRIYSQGPSEVTDIVNALEDMRLRLHSLELQKSSFIRHISHELKTPLAAIREGTELLYDNSVGPLNKDQQEICDIIRTSVTRLQRLIEDLLDFNIVLDSTSLHGLEKIDITKLIDDVCQVRKLDIKSKKMTVICNNSTGYISSNSKQLEVILDNILSNAIKYSPIEGSINISFVETPQNTTVSVVDQGPGINSDIKDKVFDAFYQGKAPENSLIKGSGLGLTIVKELLLRLNGTIEISDANKYDAKISQGTCVSICLPNKQSGNE